MDSRIISQISPTFGKIPRKFPEKFGNLVQISGIQSKFREFSQDFGNLNWIFQWILRTFQWFEHYSKTLKYYWILQFTEILWNSSDSHWNSQPSTLPMSKLWFRTEFFKLLNFTEFSVISISVYSTFYVMNLPTYSNSVSDWKNMNDFPGGDDTHVILQQNIHKFT